MSNTLRGAGDLLHAPGEHVLRDEGAGYRPQLSSAL